MKPRKDAPAHAMTDRCQCKHDFGSHDSSARGSPCGAVVQGLKGPEPCKCARFVRAYPVDHVPTFDGEAMKGALRRAAELHGDPGGPPWGGPVPGTTRGDNLLLHRIAVALERIADTLDQNSIMVRLATALGMSTEDALKVVARQTARKAGGK